MDSITQSFVQIWWTLEAADVATILTWATSGITVIATSGLISWGVQHWKRRHNIDLRKRGKALILGALSAASVLASLADWYLLNYPTHLPVWLVGGSSLVFTLATILHRIHVSPMYAKLTAVAQGLANQLDQARGTTDQAPATPPPLTFEK